MADKGRMVKMWLKKSVDDLRVATFLLDQDSEQFRASSVFHAQQSVEKAIKGYLAHNKVRFPKTHDIEKLVKLVEGLDAELAQKLEPAKVLTQFAIAYRYPEEAEPPEPLSHSTCKKSADMAQKIYGELMKKSGL